MQSSSSQSDYSLRQPIIASLAELAPSLVFDGDDEKEWAERSLRAGNDFLLAFESWRREAAHDKVPLREPYLRYAVDQIFSDALDGFRRDIERGDWVCGGLRLDRGSAAYLSAFDWVNASFEDMTKLTFVALVLERGASADHAWANDFEPHEHEIMRLPWTSRLWDPGCGVLPTEPELRRFAAQRLPKEHVGLVTIPCRRIRDGSGGKFDTEVRALCEAISAATGLWRLATLAVAAWSLELVGREAVAGRADASGAGLRQEAVAP